MKIESYSSSRIKSPEKGEESKYIKAMKGKESMIVAKRRWVNDVGMQSTILRTCLYVKMPQKSCELETETKLTFRLRRLLIVKRSRRVQEEARLRSDKV
jgi:hypothetical protein